MAVAVSTAEVLLGGREGLAVGVVAMNANLLSLLLAALEQDTALFDFDSLQWRLVVGFDFLRF